MFRARNLPPMPFSIQTMQIPDVLMTTERNTPFVQFIDRDSGMMVLASDDQLRQLAQCDMLFMDGTFKTCPSLWSQLYLIKGTFRHGQNLVLSAILLNSKTQETYTQMFRKLKSLVMEKHGLTIEPRLIMSDFETGLIPAVRQEFPDSQHKGCYFHYSQAIFRFISNSGLEPYFLKKIKKRSQ